MRLWLIGMMGSGKSSAGLMAAEALGVPFHDTDDLVVEQTGMTVAQLWTEQGEGAFRDHEKTAMRDAATLDGIISTGGGVVLDADSRALLAGSKVVWLQASPPVLAERLVGTSSRPSLVDADEGEENFLADTLRERTRLYESVATHRIDTEDLSVEAIAGMIGEIWRS